MKSFNLNVPDDKAQEFAKEMVALMQKHGVTVENQKELNALVPIKERIKTFEDACKWCQENGKGELVSLYEKISNVTNELSCGTSEITAYLQLRIITAALNEGWLPEFTKDEYRYYPWFILYTQDEIDEMDEEERGRVLGRSGGSAGAGAGVAYSSTNYASSDSYTNGGGRLCFKTSELAKYAGETFIEIWAKFMML